MKLYHGTNQEFSRIDLLKSKPNKDFGRGFYLSADYEQALNMAQIKVEQLGTGTPIVMSYEIKDEAWQRLRVLHFDNYSEEYINSLFNSNVDLLMNTNQRKINDLNLQLHKLEIDRDNIDPKLEKLVHTEEMLEIEQENLDKLKKRAEEYNLTKEILEEAYSEMKKNITPKFNQSLSKNIEKISNGKYKNIIINDNITVELEDGRYVPAESLSIGTIEQIYLSLRLAIMNEITKEKLPVMLDEAFAYYDDKRLEAALEFLSKVDNQVILFTCTDREKNLLDKNNIQYNYISL